jgi:uncharacterized membrane protein
MNWSSFFIGASLVAVCVAVWSQLRQWQALKRKKRDEQESFNNRIRFDLPIAQSHIEVLFRRIEKLEKRSKR